MSVPLPRGKLGIWISSGLLALAILVTTLGAIFGARDRKLRHEATAFRDEMCAEEKKGCEDAKHQYETLAKRAEERAAEKIEWYKKQNEALRERVAVCPCCPNGCDRELIYKDYLLQSQATYYKKHLKKVCGVKRPPDPDEKELKKFMDEMDEEEDEVF